MHYSMIAGGKTHQFSTTIAKQYVASMVEQN
jgi:hypothetical protein